MFLQLYGGSFIVFSDKTFYRSILGTYTMIERSIHKCALGRFNFTLVKRRVGALYRRDGASYFYTDVFGLD